uniref:Putative secreted protein n=1 Tax=Panstrongylus lignarius TaxID=156445 RepID=A0A224Y6N3_9HEMI
MATMSAILSAVLMVFRSSMHAYLLSQTTSKLQADSDKMIGSPSSAPTLQIKLTSAPQKPAELFCKRL